MNIADLFQSLHGAVNKEALIPLKERTRIQETCPHLALPNEEEVEKVLSFTNTEIGAYYVQPNGGIHPYCYYHEGLFLDIPVFSMEYANFMQLEKRITMVSERLKLYKEEQDFDSYFGFVEKKIVFEEFQRVYHDIPKEQRYDVFSSIYTRSEYGFDRLPEEFVRDVFSHKMHSDENKAHLERLKEEHPEEWITIYRGVTNKSTPLEKAYSWTTDEEIALFFANRFGARGKILEGRVQQEQVIDYLTGRNEREILVLPEHVNVI